MRLTAEKKKLSAKSQGSNNRKTQRKSRAGLWQRLPKKPLTFSLLSLSLLGGMTLSWQSGWVSRTHAELQARFLQESALAGLSVDQVLVEGRQRTDADLVLEQLAVQRGSAILAFDPDQARERLESLTWIASAEVERRFPETIFVRLKERQPVARWQQDSHIQVIDTTGLPLKGVDARSFRNLPLVVGPEAPQQADALLSLLSLEPEMARQVVAAVWVGKRRWDLHLQDETEIQLPEKGAAQAWQSFAEIERETGILSRDVEVIDLRLPDRMVVRTSKGAQPAGGHGADDLEGHRDLRPGEQST